MPFTLKKAGLLRPDTLREEIVRDFDNNERRTGDGVVSTQEVFPLVELSSSRETYFTQHGGTGPMQATGLSSESPITDLEDLGQRDVTVNAYKSKVSPEKGVDTDLNSDEEIYRLFAAAANHLREQVAMTRDVIAWRGDAVIDGMIGQYGNTPHPDIPTDNLISPATSYSDHANATPQNDVMRAEYLLDEYGFAGESSGQVTMYAPPSALYDFKLNADLSDRFSGVEVQGLTEDQVANILPVDRVRKVRIKVPRANANGEFIDADGNVAQTPRDAVWDNILEPWDPSANAGAGGKRRNILVGLPGQASAMMPWYADRLAEHADNAPPSGQFAVDQNAGILTQTWTEHDPAVSWLKVAQELGLHLQRPQNWVVIRNV